MSPEQERQLLQVVSEALARTPENRGVFLQQSIGNDSTALAEALSLVTFQSRTEICDDLAPTQQLSGFVSGAIIGNRFRVIRFIGRGGMGDVYEVEDLAQARHPRVALKTIRPEIASNPQILRQFEREIEIGKTITHPNVCRIYDLGVHRRAPEEGAAASPATTIFLTMELLNGPTLYEHLRSGDAMSCEEAQPILRQVADALHAAHQANIIHRDLKPGNIMLISAGAHPRVRAVVTDFGLAREIADPDTAMPMTIGVGTPDYMSPEQINGDPAGPPSDIYSLGVVAYRMVTGRLPFEGEHPLLRMVKRLHERPAPPRTHTPSLPQSWETAILRCLDREPANRFETALDFAKALDDSTATGDTPAADLLHNNPRTDQTQGSIGNRIGSRGVKLVVGFIFLLALLIALRLWQQRHAQDARALPSEKRVAVLKFENIGGDPVSEAFCDGLMESLTSKLTDLQQFHRSLSLVPASDVRREHVKSARDAQREFGVNLVITGSVQRSGNRVHLIINLVDAKKLKQLRSQESSLSQTDVLAMQDGVVRSVADLLELELRPEAVHRLAEGNTSVPGAYDFYLQGAGYLLRGKGATDQAIQEFDRALHLDPNYAPAHAGLGEAYWYKYQDTKDRGWIDQAWKECEAAIQLNPNDAAAHITLTVLNAGMGRYDEAIRHGRQAIAIDPLAYRAYSEMSRALDASGRSTEAENTLKRAIELQPGYWNSHMQLGSFYYRHGRYKEAEAAYRRVTELVPDNPAGYTNLGVIYHLQGREADAERMLKQSLRSGPPPHWSRERATCFSARIP